MADGGTRARPRLGLDVYSLRSSGWPAEVALDYCADLGAEVVLFSEPRFLGSLDDRSLRSLRERADGLHVDLEVGMGSICPTSAAFRADDGTAWEQLTKMLHVAAALGSPIVRCYLGSSADRGRHFRRHIANTIATCLAVEATAVALGVKVAIENHAGDLQSAQLRDLIERTGPHFVGALFDAGNAAWTLEEPLAALETLAPYVLSSGIRDSKVWETPDGAAVEWVALGAGDARIDELAARYATLCPGKPFVLEIIPYPARAFDYRRRTFWDDYRDVPAPTFARFEEWARRGMERHGRGDAPPDGQAQSAIGSPADHERAAVEAAMAYARTELGLGRQAPAGNRLGRRSSRRRRVRRASHEGHDASSRLHGR